MIDTHAGLSLSELKRERGELQKDYRAFGTAYDTIRRRIQESTDLEPVRAPQLRQWSGSRAVCGALELSIHAIERTIAEYEDLIRRIEAGEIPNTDRPVLGLVKE